MHDRLELPEPVTFVGDSAQLVLLLVRDTNAAKRFRAVTVIEEVAALLTCAATVAGLAAMVKS